MIGISRRFFIGASVALGSSVRTCFGKAFDSTPLSTDIQFAVDRERRNIQAVMARERVEGVAVCLIHGGRPAWIEGFGVTQQPHGRAVNEHTMFSIQSTSKNIAATAVMIAVQQGLLDLDTPIVAYLPDFTVQSRFAPKPQEQITLRLLLSHRAGFTHEAPVGNNYDPAFPSFEAHVLSISRTWLRYPVGERYRYSNLGYDLAGYILQMKSGVPFAEWVRKELLAPLGMKDSTFATDVYAASQNRAVGHAEHYPAVPLRTPLVPSGGLYTSARDFAAYSEFHLNRGRFEGRQVLNEALWNEMHGFALGGDYGLGVIRLERRYGATSVRLLSHKGGGFGFGSVYVYCPEAGLAWAAFFNRPVDDCYRFGEALLEEALVRRFGPRQPRLSAASVAPITPTSRQRSNLIGRYVGRSSVVAILDQDGELVKEEEGARSAVRFLSPDECFTVDGSGEVVCYRSIVRQDDLPAHLECFIGEQSLDKDDDPDLPAGPAKKEWSKYIGSYHLNQWGRSALKAAISERQGYLYLNEIRMIIEMQPGLFFTVDGETVDFRSPIATWKNLQLLRDE